MREIRDWRFEANPLPDWRKRKSETPQAERRGDFRAGLLGVVAVVVIGCGAAESSSVICGEGTREVQGICVVDESQTAEDSVDQAEEGQGGASSPTTASTLPPPDPTLELAALVRGGTVLFNSGVLDHACGFLAFVSTQEDQRLISWKNDRWDTEITVPDQFDLAGQKVSEFLTRDLTGDGRAEIVIRWAPEFAMREMGAVLRVDSPGCSWSWQELVDSCSSRVVYEGINVSSEGDLIGSGWSGGCSPRESVRFRWFPEVGRFVARPFSSDTQMCGSYDEFAIDLPLRTCSRTWAVKMFQEGLRDAGFSMNPDGYFGPGTQVAVIGYQQRLGLDVSGLIDELTWASMFPVNWDDGFPDYDGDGISSPREIAHWGGG